MTLRKKTLMIVGLTIIGLLVILYFVTQITLVRSFTELEEQYTRQNVERALSALFNDLLTLDAIANDWAAWDDTYDFIEDANDEYLQSNLIDGTFTELRLNLMLFINPSGQIVYGKAFDLQNEEEIPVPQALQEHLSAGDLLVYHPDTESSISGIVLLPEAPVLVVSQPILTSEDEGPIRGALIMGRYLDTNEIEKLAEQTHLSLTMHRYDYSSIPTDFQAAIPFLSEEAPILVRPLDEQSIAGYALLKDIYEQPILLLRVDMPRDIYAQGQASVSYFILSLLAIGLVLGAVIILLLDRQVLSRLAHLSKSVTSIGASGDLSARVSMTGKDELSSLGDTINGMLAALEESEERYRALLELGGEVGEAVVMLQDTEQGNGIQTFVSDEWPRITGYSRRELLGMSFFDLVHSKHREASLERHQRKMRGESVPRLFELSIVRKDGTEVPIELTSAYSTYQGKRANVAFIRDITERKRMEHELQEKNEQLDVQNEELQSQTEELMTQQQELIEKTGEVEKANQLKSEFLANMSHGLRTPLNVIIGFSELMRDEVPGKINDEQRQCLEDVLASSQHLLNLISKVLDLSKIESGRTKLNLADLALTEVIESLARTMLPILAPRKQSLDVEIEEGLPLVHADKVKVSEVLLNLLSNATKFTPEGGRLKIEAVREGDWCRVSVIDNGIGIKKEDQEQIFEPFCQLDNPLTKRKSGTGLGLTLVKQIIEKHGGQIRVESEYEKGSRFIFTLPLTTTN